MSQHLPPFLRPLPADSDGICPAEDNLYFHAVFRHSEPLGSAHAMWWPSGVSIEDSTVVLFIPGNPGLCSFYTSFLSGIRTEASNIAILAHSHLGHTPGTIDQDVFGNPQGITLESQVKSSIEAFDAIQYILRPKHVVLISHSIGGWIALQVLKARAEHVSAALMLFPTVCDIAKSPNGQKLSRFFNHPFPLVISTISPLLRLVPIFALKLLFLAWPTPQIHVLRGLLHSPAAIYSTLTMAGDEMVTIRDLDADLVMENKDRIWFYFAESDGWVGDSREKILEAFHHDTESLRVVYGEADIPHAFCIKTDHSSKVANKCLSWMSSAGLL